MASTPLKNVLLLESISDQAFQLLSDHSKPFLAEQPSEVMPFVRSNPIHAIITRGKGIVDRELISNCPELQVIARCGVGLDNIDVAYATERAVKVINAPGSNADTVAEHTLSLMLALQRNLYNSLAAVKNNHWDFRTNYSGDEIRGKTLGILGLGDIGGKVAKLASVFGMSVIYWGQTNKPGVSYPFKSFEEVLSSADIVSLHLPLTKATQNILNAEALQKMRRGALIINPSRGALINEHALVSALGNGQLGGYAADVLSEEPPAPDNALIALDNVLITPHSASLTARTYHHMCMVSVQNTLDVLNDKIIDPLFIFNRTSL